MKITTLLILLSAVFINIFAWTFINKPHNFIDSKYPTNSFSFNPYKKNQSPFEYVNFTRKEIESDLKILVGKTKAVRIYSSRNGLEQVPEVAEKYGFSVITSAYLDSRPIPNANDIEVEAAIKMANQHKKTVQRVILGNETQLLKILPREDLIRYLRKARREVRQPVSTAEPWDFWIQEPSFVKEVDYIAIHVLPYWNEVPIDQAVDYVIGKYFAVKNAFPKKEVLIAETGWPSDGPQKGAAIASQANQAAFVRSFMQRAEELKLNYNIVEAFDQPWKNVTEGSAGEHWGLLDADRQEKFPLNGPVLEDPNWKYWAATSTLLGFLAASLFLFRRQDLKKRGQFFSVCITILAAVFVTELAREATDQYMSPGKIIFWAVMIIAQALLAIILLTDAIEIADVIGYKPLKRKYLPLAEDPDIKYPMVSIHLACCREPPEMVIATINSLAKLDYPNFEVIVVDNNTPDDALWKPVQARCQELGSHFRFFSLGNWPGFKAGALNFALKETNPEARIVGVVDADYIVHANWLKATIPYFDDADVGVVQAPQEHRDYDSNAFKKMENDEYSGFFRIGMVQRNEHNAIIQHGTMTLISRGLLNQLQWSEWCICEDAELGLRVLNEGKKAIYLDHAFGHGLVPDTYEAYSKQRFRWAYGGMRILRHHWRIFFGLSGQLTRMQRYLFIKGWLPWMGDALHMAFSFGALIWSLVLIADPLSTDFPDPIFIYPALMLVLLRLLGTLWTYMARVKIGRKRTLLAMIADGSLTHKIAKAVFQGLFTTNAPFYRTPKMEIATPLIKSLLSVREELTLASLLILCASLVVNTFGIINREAVLWSVALLIQGIPYYAAIIAAIVSTFDADTKPVKEAA